MQSSPLLTSYMQNGDKEQHSEITLNSLISAVRLASWAVLLKYWICPNARQTNNLHHNRVYPWYCCSFVCDVVKSEPTAPQPHLPHTQVITLSWCSQFSLWYVLACAHVPPHMHDRLSNGNNWGRRALLFCSDLICIVLHIWRYYQKAINKTTPNGQFHAGLKPTATAESEMIQPFVL